MHGHRGIDRQNLRQLGIADGNQGIQTAQGKTVNELLEEGGEVNEAII